MAIEAFYNPLTGRVDAAPKHNPFATKGLDTTGVTAGLCGYISGNLTVSKTDAAAIATAYAFGINEGIAGTMTRSGAEVRVARFSMASPLPTFGLPIFLARADDEPGGAAAGKLTMIAPTSGVIAPVGTVIAVDALTYPSTRVAHIHFERSHYMRLST